MSGCKQQQSAPLCAYIQGAELHHCLLWFFSISQKFELREEEKKKSWLAAHRIGQMQSVRRAGECPRVSDPSSLTKQETFLGGIGAIDVGGQAGGA